MPRTSRSMRLTDEEWFRRTGGVAMSIGNDTFHRELIELFGSTIKHNSSWIMRYSRFAPPDVLYTHNVSDEIVQLYTRECFSIDPFSNHWKIRGTPGVLTLSSLKAENVEFIIYSKIFGGAANISDEMAMFFTTVGHCCLGLFLVRENGTFSPTDVNGRNSSSLRLMATIMLTSVGCSMDFDIPTVPRWRASSSDPLSSKTGSRNEFIPTSPGTKPFPQIRRLMKLSMPPRPITLPRNTTSTTSFSAQKRLIGTFP